MAQHNETGKEGEQFVREYLVKQGYKIRATNWHFGHKEIDLVTEKDGMMVFVEVKSRSNLTFELPQESVTKKKQKNLVEAADAYLIQKNIELESRFDIVTVLASEPPRILEHIEDAFRPNELI